MNSSSKFDVLGSSFRSTLVFTIMFENYFNNVLPKFFKGSMLFISQRLKMRHTGALQLY